MKTLKQKLLEVGKKIEYLQKDKKNTMQGYKYLSEAKIKEKVKEQFEVQGIIFFYTTEEVTISEISPTSKGTRQFCTIAKGNYSFLDTDSDERIDGHWIGAGTDTGDKGLYKAITGGIKYILNTTFLIPTGDDPEEELGNEYENKSEEKYITDQQLHELRDMMLVRDADAIKFCKFLGVDSLDKLPADKYQQAINTLKMKPVIK